MNHMHNTNNITSSQIKERNTIILNRNNEQLFESTKKFMESFDVLLKEFLKETYSKDTNKILFKES